MPAAAGLDKGLLNVGQQLWIANQVANAVSVIFVKDVVATPAANGFDVHLLYLRSHTPADLKWRAFFVIARACGGAGILHWGTGIGGNVQRLLIAIALSNRSQLGKVGGAIVVNEYIHLRFYS